jgi:hypothetical protein
LLAGLDALDLPLGAAGHVGAGGHREATGYRDRGAGHQDGGRVVERREESAHGPQDLHQPVIESEKDAANGLRVHAALDGLADDHVLVAELVLEDLADGATERVILVRLPHREVLADAVDLDGFQNEVDRAVAEETADEDEESELEAASPIERLHVAAEELFPEGEVPGLDGDQLAE